MSAIPFSDSSAHAPLVEALRAILPSSALKLDLEERRPYECDGLSAYRALPGIVCLPETAGQVGMILRACHDHAVPVVARGAGTGLSGGALPLTNGVLLSLARLNRIIEVDAANRTATVEPGVRNLAISEAAAPSGLYYAPDPSSQIACSIGGNVAENAGGVHCLKYGLTVHNLLGLTFYTAEGELITLGGKSLDSDEGDLLALLTGSEGLLGVIVEVIVKLLPRPEQTRVLLTSFADVESAGRAVADIIGSGILPAGLEMMDNLAIRAAEDYAQAGYPVEAAAILLVELDGCQAEVESDVMHVAERLRAAGASDVRISRDEAERLRMWAGRKAAFPAVGRLAPDYYCMDGTIPRGALARVLTRIADLSHETGLPVANVFHAGDGNLHPLILYDANKPGELARVEAFGARILELCIEAGGTVTGEHGVGVEKLGPMCSQFTHEELNQFHRIKHAFDPDGRLNPGKAIPTLARCAEYGRMHVHSGIVPHPELERY